MVRSLLVRGMLAGLIAGVLGFLFARLIGEPYVEQAIAFESYVEHTVHHEAPQVELVSRQLQSSAGLATGTLIFGVAMGGLFSLVFAIGNGRIAALSPRGTAALLGPLAFVALYLTPFLKYPPNPPSIGDPDTIGQRTQLYVALIVVSVAAMVLVVMLRAKVEPKLGGWNATLLAGAVYLAVIGLAFAIFPGVNEVPQQELPGVVQAVTGDDVTFPPSVLWGFRLSSLGLQAVTWTANALVFGWLAQRRLAEQGQAAKGWSGSPRLEASRP
jgi:hypothetical protein